MSLTFKIETAGIGTSAGTALYARQRLCAVKDGSHAKTSVVNIGIPHPPRSAASEIAQVISGLRAVLLRQPLRAATVVDLKPRALRLHSSRSDDIVFGSRSLAVVRNPFN